MQKVTPFRRTTAQALAAEREDEARIARLAALFDAIATADPPDIVRAVETRQIRDADFDGVALGDRIGRACWPHLTEREHALTGGEGVS